MLWVKRIQRQIDGSLLLISDNSTYPPMPLALAEHPRYSNHRAGSAGIKRLELDTIKKGNRMKILALLIAATCALSACGGQAEEQPASAQPQEQAQSELKTMPVSYTDYQSVANKGLADQKTGLTLPEHVVPADNAEGKNLLHDFSDGLTLTVDTDKADKITAVRIVWNTDAVPQKAEKLSKAAAALIAATAPGDRTLLRDTGDQIKMAIDSHNAQKEPTREWARGGIAYKVTVTNLPSVVLTAKAE